MRPRSESIGILGSIASVLLLAACATAPVSTAPVAVPLGEFCSAAQAITSGSSIRGTNVVHSDYEEFVLSKAVIRPLRTEQYHWYEDEAKTRLKMISCKMKTADHFRTEYGADQAGEERSCADVNRQTIDQVLGAMSKTERRRLLFDHGRNIVLDPDELTNMGPVWLEPYAMSYVGTDGALHIMSKAMRNDWLDERYFQAPPKFRGTRYCHLIAPEYLARVLRGEVRLSAATAERT